MRIPIREESIETINSLDNNLIAERRFE
jgi:hypothetical protein